MTCRNCGAGGSTPHWVHCPRRPASHRHRPAPGTRSDMAHPAADEYRTAYRPGTRAVCITCGRPIIYNEGYEMRRDHWRATGPTKGAAR